MLNKDHQRNPSGEEVKQGIRQLMELGNNFLAEDDSGESPYKTLHTFFLRNQAPKQKKNKPFKSRDSIFNQPSNRSRKQQIQTPSFISTGGLSQQLLAARMVRSHERTGQVCHGSRKCQQGEERSLGGPDAGPELLSQDSLRGQLPKQHLLPTFCLWLVNIGADEDRAGEQRRHPGSSDVCRTIEGQAEDDLDTHPGEAEEPFFVCCIAFCKSQAVR